MTLWPLFTLTCIFLIISLIESDSEDEMLSGILKPLGWKNIVYVVLLKDDFLLGILSKRMCPVWDESL